MDEFCAASTVGTDIAETKKSMLSDIVVILVLLESFVIYFRRDFITTIFNHVERVITRAGSFWRQFR